jgi:alpha-L-rhamnosidase
VEIPVNTTATIYIPATDAANVMIDGKPASQSADVKMGELKDGYVMMDAGSGKYSFSAPGVVN